MSKTQSGFQTITVTPFYYGGGKGGIRVKEHDTSQFCNLIFPIQISAFGYPPFKVIIPLGFWCGQGELTSNQFALALLRNLGQKLT
jgi:hypothetical protein